MFHRTRWFSFGAFDRSRNDQCTLKALQVHSLIMMLTHSTFEYHRRLAHAFLCLGTASQGEPEYPIYCRRMQTAMEVLSKLAREYHMYVVRYTVRKLHLLIRKPGLFSALTTANASSLRDGLKYSANHRVLHLDMVDNSSSSPGSTFRSRRVRKMHLKLF